MVNSFLRGKLECHVTLFGLAARGGSAYLSVTVPSYASVDILYSSAKNGDAVSRSERSSVSIPLFKSRISKSKSCTSNTGVTLS